MFETDYVGNKRKKCILLVADATIHVEGFSLFFPLFNVDEVTKKKSEKIVAVIKNVIEF